MHIDHAFRQAPALHRKFATPFLAPLVQSPEWVWGGWGGGGGGGVEVCINYSLLMEQGRSNTCNAMHICCLILKSSVAHA